MFKYKLGQELKDKVSGFAGIAMGRTEYSDGSMQYGLAAGPGKLNRDGLIPKWQWVDEIRLESTGKDNFGAVAGHGIPVPKKQE